MEFPKSGLITVTSNHILLDKSQVLRESSEFQTSQGREGMNIGE